MLSLSALAVIFIGPFIFVRFAQGNISVAIIDAIATLVMGCFFAFIYKTRKVKTARLSIAIFLVAVVLIDIYLIGLTIIYWCYPIILVVSYLTPYQTALKINSIAMVILAFIIYPLIDTIEFSLILINLLLINVFSYVMFRSIQKNDDVLGKLATTDPLTNCLNRRALQEKLIKITDKHDRSPYSLFLIMFDLDHFKLVNDTYGHTVGDEVLVNVSHIVQNNIRSFENMYRYGGEEFIVLPLEVEVDQAMLIANKLRELVESYVFPSDVRVTISLGVAQYKAGEKPSEWIDRADAALYKAKESGRNRVELAN